MPVSRPIAVVTGASSGIGATYAEHLATRGYDLILVARRAERLQALSAKLAQAHGAKIETVDADLTQETVLRASSRFLPLTPACPCW